MTLPFCTSSLSKCSHSPLSQAEKTKSNKAFLNNTCTWLNGQNNFYNFLNLILQIIETSSHKTVNTRFFKSCKRCNKKGACLTVLYSYDCSMDDLRALLHRKKNIYLRLIKIRHVSWARWWWCLRRIWAPWATRASCSTFTKVTLYLLNDLLNLRIILILHDVCWVLTYVSKCCLDFRILVGRKEKYYFYELSQSFFHCNQVYWLPLPTSMLHYINKWMLDQYIHTIN